MAQKSDLEKSCPNGQAQTEEPISLSLERKSSQSNNKDVPSLFKSGRLHIVMCILFCELCERLTYYSIAGNLVLYCTSALDYSSEDAATISLVFSGTAYFVPLFGGWLADSFAGKYNTIYGSLLIYMIGAALLPVISIEFENFNSGLSLSDSAKQGYFMFALITIAIGTGGIKANVGPFGAQQLDDLGETAIQTFFNWFYWFINMGSTIAFSIGVYVQQEYGFALGYTIPAVSIFAAIIILAIGKAWYIVHPPEGSPLTTVSKVVITGASQCRHPHIDAPEMDSCIDRVKESYGGKFPDKTVEEVKSLGRIMPIFATIVLYWTVYFQMSTTYLLQGERMRLIYGNFSIPVASLSLFNSIVILILVPIVDRFVYPFFARCGMPLSKLQRIGIGMIFASISVVIAAGIEIARKNIMQEGGWMEQELAGEKFNASTLSVFAQIPQFTIIGASEVFTSITGLEFAYSQSPSYMQGVVMGLFLATTGLGSYVGSLLVAIVNSASRAQGAEWFPDEINDGYLEYYFFLLAGLMLINFGIFVIIAKKYKYVNQYSSEDERRRSGGKGSRQGEKTPLLSESECL
ncbi:LOW QUALITY PROTEIN: solute carrier family 15 member 4-like [Amphiura filiformis]|uniref:LOW QUALITY PROTEIN: solute carrier family 15 member 4-like n=1 Tax=Amphiura filiformis TaxID=82378 RepID=UPI003B213FE2